MRSREELGFIGSRLKHLTLHTKTQPYSQTSKWKIPWTTQPTKAPKKNSAWTTTKTPSLKCVNTTNESSDLRTESLSASNSSTSSKRKNQTNAETSLVLSTPTSLHGYQGWWSDMFKAGLFQGNDDQWGTRRLKMTTKQVKLLHQETMIPNYNIIPSITSSLQTRNAMTFSMSSEMILQDRSTNQILWSRMWGLRCQPLNDLSYSKSTQIECEASRLLLTKSHLMWEDNKDLAFPKTLENLSILSMQQRKVKLTQLLLYHQAHRTILLKNSK